MKHTKLYNEPGVGVHFGYVIFVFFYAFCPYPLLIEIATQIYCMHKESIILEARINLLLIFKYKDSYHIYILYMLEYVYPPFREDIARRKD